MKPTFLFLTIIWFTCAGCGEQRDTLTPKRALGGHWRDGKGVEWYFADGGRCTVEEKGAAGKGRYEVYRQDPVDRKIKFRVTMENGLIYLFDGKFTKRFREYSGEVKVYNPKVSAREKTEEFNLVFIDCKTKP